MASAKRKPGRPRQYESVSVCRNPEEIEITDTVMRYAQKHGVSFEMAFGRVGVTHPNFEPLAETVSHATDVKRNAARSAVAPSPEAVTRVQVLSARQAAQEWDVNPVTLVKWLNAGRVYGRKTEDGGWIIPADQPIAIRDLQRHDWRRRGREVQDEPDPREVARAEVELDDAETETARAAREFMARVLLILEARR